MQTGTLDVILEPEKDSRKRHCLTRCNASTSSTARERKTRELGVSLPLTIFNRKPTLMHNARALTDGHLNLPVMLMRVWITIHFHDRCNLITIKPNPAAFYLVPIAIAVIFTHIFVTCDKFVIMYMCCVGAVMDALLHNTQY